MSVVIERLEGKRLRVSSGTAETLVEGSDDATGAFRSVELLLASLGSCMVGTMLSAATERGLAVEGVRVELKPMVAFGPERVTKIRMKMALEGDLDEEQLAFLREAAESCKVHTSLHSGIQTHLEVEHAGVPS